MAQLWFLGTALLHYVLDWSMYFKLMAFYNLENYGLVKSENQQWQIPQKLWVAE